MKWLMSDMNIFSATNALKIEMVIFQQLLCLGVLYGMELEWKCE